MLWLRKRQDDQLIFSDQDSKEYIKNEMISYNDYIKSIESVPLTSFGKPNDFGIDGPVIS